MNTSIPIDIKPMLNEYCKLLSEHLPDAIYAVYLYGSVVLGAYKYPKSDIDYITLLKRPFKDEETNKLKDIHRSLKRKYKLAKKLDGMYIEESYVGLSIEEVGPHLYYHDGKLKLGSWNVNAVTWWFLQTSKCKLMGDDLSFYHKNTSWSDVINAMNYNLNVYWYKKIEHPCLLLFDKWASETVGTLARIQLTLEEQRIISKDEAFDIAILKWTDDWGDILHEGYRIRKGEKSPLNISYRINRMKQIKRYFKFIRLHTKKYFGHS